MLNQSRLEILDDLVNIGVIHADEQDVLNRGNKQDVICSWTKDLEMRRLMGQKRIVYELSKDGTQPSFRVPILGKIRCNRRVLFRRLAEHLVSFVLLDPLQLDYRLVTDSFKGPFAGVI